MNESIIQIASLLIYFGIVIATVILIKKVQNTNSNSEGNYEKADIAAHGNSITSAK